MTRRERWRVIDAWIVATDDRDRVEPCGHPVELNYRTARDLRDREAL